MLNSLTWHHSRLLCVFGKQCIENSVNHFVRGGVAPKMNKLIVLTLKGKVWIRLNSIEFNSGHIINHTGHFKSDFSRYFF